MTEFSVLFVDPALSSDRHTPLQNFSRIPWDSPVRLACDFPGKLSSPGTALSHTARRLVSRRISRTLIAPLVRDFPVLPFFLNYLKLVNVTQIPSDPRMRQPVVTHILDLAALVLGARSDAAQLARRRAVPAAHMQRLKDYIAAEAGNPGLTLTCLLRSTACPCCADGQLRKVGENMTVCLPDLRSDQAVHGTEGQSVRQMPALDVKLMTKHQDLGFQRGPRPEQ
jgi:hypothetical protein